MATGPQPRKPITAQLLVRGHPRRTVYRVEDPFLRRGMAETPLFLIAVRGQHYLRFGHVRQRDPVFYCVNAAYVDGHWTLPLAAQTLLT